MKINMLKKLMLFGITCLVISNTGCEKYLDEKSKQSLVVPTTLADYKALLNDVVTLNESVSPYLTEVFSDNYYLTKASYDLYALEDRQSYIWDKDFTEVLSTNWAEPYRGIYIVNSVLDGVEKIEENPQNKLQREEIKGTALFFRAFLFERLAQIYCKPYAQSADTDLGIVLRLNSDINEKSVRSTVQQTYDQITTDLKIAYDLLPEVTSDATRPTKTAALACLARTYLAMRKYEDAGSYANLALQKKSGLIDYNLKDPLSSPRFVYNEIEVIFYSRAYPSSIIIASRAKVDPTLFDSYNSNDLRKTLFFSQNTGANIGTYAFRGSYAGLRGVTSQMNGLTTAELYLIRAECNARAGNRIDALADLNTLMIKRWRNNGSFVPFAAATADQAKTLVLNERRKELAFRGLRWSDIRRLNLEGANITLERNIGGVIYSLPPNDLRYVALIPNSVISKTGIPQNPR